MITGELKNKIDKIWDDMYSYGIANPLTVIEQLTYLFFIRSLDEVETANERQDSLLGITTDRIFPENKQHLRWSKFKGRKAEEIFQLLRDEVFPFIKKLQNGKKSSYARYMRDANFLLPNALITEKVVTAIDALPLQDRDLKGDIYEYMISKLQTAGRIGQFRTPRHIIKMMVRLIDPKPEDTIADPACGTGGFLVLAGQYIKDNNKDELLTNRKFAQHFASTMFTGYDTDQTMLRISAMNMILHGMDNARIQYNDSLSKNNIDTEKYSVILANPPFKGSLDHDAVSPTLTTVVNTKKTELLFLALFLRMLEPGGRCACIVPDGVLFGNSKAHIAIRKELIENHKLIAVISMPSGVFKPYAGVSTAVLVFTKTGTGGTDNVWFYDMKSDGFSLDDKRIDLGTGGDIEDIVARYKSLTTNPEMEAARARTEQSFLVPKQEIVDNGYDLSINRYKQNGYVEEHYDHPSVSIERFKELEEEILAGIAELEAMFE
ncbi:type I restriction enzyme M protein [Clostridium sp. USBA 49]|jgi:type I restriction enzyme M protein|uniref:type I restriction-modification system subunit M n=1 Tax=Clostridium sp. USBA 49 TaxID=1881060 RepID=UPI00099AA53F|nr:class I SAM-dependent DNA methyltransferase [Clostridium sp. USBA 49]SKA88405.1 type I restriction enzyme M protein [Clostridium sp. USBA 49]